MSSRDFEALRAEQAPIQAVMYRQREITEYETDFLFPSMVMPNGSDSIRELFAPSCIEPEFSLAGILRSMAAVNRRRAHWVDRGGGYAIALRQAAADPQNAGKIRTTNVDLFNLDPNDLDLSTKVTWKENRLAYGRRRLHRGTSKPT